MGVIWDGLIDGDDIEKTEIRLRHEMRRRLSLGMLTLPVPARLGPGPWHVRVTVETNRMLMIAHPDEYEVSIKVHMRRVKQGVA